MQPRDEVANARRKLFLDISRRRQKPGSGSQPWKRGEKFRLNWPKLAEVLAGMPWAIVGGVATRNYMPERSTVDLDIAILPADAARAGERLRNAGYRSPRALTIGGTTWTSPDGIEVDVIEGPDRWWPEALAAAGGNLDADGAPVLTLPYLVLMKTLASREIDLGDVSKMLGFASDTEVEAVRLVVARWAPDLLQDLEGMIAQAKLEWGR